MYSLYQVNSEATADKTFGGEDKIFSTLLEFFGKISEIYYLFTYLFIYLLIYLFTYLFIYLFNKYLDRTNTSVTIVTAVSVCPV